MIPLSEVFANPLYTFCIGLFLGLWAASLVWVWRYAAGYRDGVKYCNEALEPVRVEIATLAGLRHVSEGMRQALKAAQEAQEGEETRH